MYAFSEMLFDAAMLKHQSFITAMALCVCLRVPCIRMCCVRACNVFQCDAVLCQQAYLDALKRMNMKVKDFGASSALLPPRMRIPSRTTSPVGSGRLSSARRHLSGTARSPVSVVEEESHMEDMAAKITARQLSERESGETRPASLRGDGGGAASAVGDVTRTAGMSEVDAIVFELRSKHAEKLEENLRSIGVLRPDRSRVLHAQSTQSTASLDEQKSLAVGTGTGGVTQSADSIKVIASTARGQGGYRNDATAQTKAGLVSENVIGHGVNSPTDSEANKGRSSASTHSGARWRHLKPLYVEGHTQTPPAPPPTATEADVQTSVRSGETTMSAESVPRGGATVVKWDKMSNSSDYDADDDDDDDVCDELGVLPATPRTAVSQWAQKEQTKAEQEVNEDQTKEEQEVDDEQNEAEQELAEEQNETEPEVEKERNETEQEIEEGPNEEQVEEEQNEMEPKVESKRNEEEVEEQEEEQNETEPDVENEEEQDQEKPASTPESFICSATIDSFANVRNYLMTYVPEIPEMTEERPDAEERALPSTRQLQVWQLNLQQSS